MNRNDPERAGACSPDRRSTSPHQISRCASIVSRPRTVPPAVPAPSGVNGSAAGSKLLRSRSQKLTLRVREGIVGQVLELDQLVASSSARTRSPTRSTRRPRGSPPGRPGASPRFAAGREPGDGAATWSGYARCGDLRNESTWMPRLPRRSCDPDPDRHRSRGTEGAAVASGPVWRSWIEAKAQSAPGTSAAVQL